jgi:hypothetical protein
MKIRFLPFITLLFCAFCSCSTGNEENKDEQEIQTLVDSFATQYYCWRFKDAARFSTEKQTQYLRFLSSNVHESDIKILTSSSERPEFTLGEISITGETATAILELSNIYQIDSLGIAPQLYKEATHHLHLAKENGQWKVDKVTCKK